MQAMEGIQCKQKKKSGLSKKPCKATQLQAWKEYIVGKGRNLDYQGNLGRRWEEIRIIKETLARNLDHQRNLER